jgi:hypothetical protein
MTVWSEKKESRKMRRLSRPIPVATGIFCVLIILALVSSPADAARKGRLAGKVTDNITGKPIAGAIVAVQGTTISTMTDKNGKFQLDLDAGKYNITIFKDEYFSTNYMDIEVEAGKITTYGCECVPGDPSQNLFFSIAGINVLDKRELLPEQIETTHEISSAEIEHNLSSSLGDVLELIPGVERTAPPGLSRETNIGLRGASNIGTSAEQQAAMFGTKIMVDDIAISNNANLQAGTGTMYGSTGTSAGGQIDLRTIPADNIANVEVITGVPSAEYGDVTTGLVKVRTKMGRQPNRLKIKSNPDTKEANFNGGIIVRGTGISYNLNGAYSERDIRRSGDEYYRYNGRFNIRNLFLDEKMDMLNMFEYRGIRDEQNVDVNDPLSIETYNRDKTYTYGNTIDFSPSPDTKLEWRGNITYTNRDSYQQKLVGSDVRILTDAEEEGTFPGVFGAGAYLSKIWTKGEEWNVGAKLSFRWNFSNYRFDHGMLFGAEYTYDNNTGKGKIFDPFFPPYGNPGQRPLPFDYSPALKNASLYIEDEIKGSLNFRPWSLILGARYEMYTPQSVNWGGFLNSDPFIESNNGSFLNPRFRFRFDFTDDTRVRLSWGKSSKMPPMTNIYQGPMYIDVVEENVSPPDSMPLVTTYIYDYDNTNLKGYQNSKAEVSLDNKLGPLALILTGFYDESTKSPRDRNDPLTIHRYRWENYPDPASRTVLDTIYTENDSGHGFFDPVGYYKKWGVEFQFLTKRIESLSTVFRVDGSFYKSRSGADGLYMSTPRNNESLGRTIYPLYNYNEAWRQKAIVNYRADWLIKKIGMWVTFHVQQTLFEKSRSVVDPVIYSSGYYDPLTRETVYISPEESKELGLDRVYDELDLAVRRVPNDRLLFNLNVSKSLGRGAEVSMFVHNFFDDQAFYVNEYGNYVQRNSDIFYGIEFSMILDNFFRRGRE